MARPGTTESPPKRRNPGIETRHARTCPADADRDATCRCSPSYRAEVYDRRAGTKIRETFPTLAAAKAWRADSIGDVRRGKLRATPAITLQAAADELVAGMEAGTIRTRSGDPYKPSVTRGYATALRMHLLPALAGRRLADVTRQDVQALADKMLADGLDPSTVRNAVMPLRVIYRRALEDGVANVNPVERLRLPAVRGRRERIADPQEAARLIAALPETDRPLWATAAYAGLRLGELWALRDEDVDLEAGVIRVERSWDRFEGAIEPKSRAGRRVVPVVAVLRVHLAARRLLRGSAGGLFFGDGDRPFDRDQIIGRAERAWRAANVETIAEALRAVAPDATDEAAVTRAAVACSRMPSDPRAKEPQATTDALEAIGLTTKDARTAMLDLDLLKPIGLHECRHTCASTMIAARVNLKALSTYLGHSSITITLDRYGHLMPGNEDEAVSLVDAYLERTSVGQSVGQ